MQNLEVRFKKLVPEAKMPSYSRQGDAALDLVATSKSNEYANFDSKAFWDASMGTAGGKVFESKYKYTEYGTGIAVEIPTGHVGLIFNRSSISNQNQALTNAVGVIDENYRGEIRFRYIKTNRDYLPEYEVGDKIGQLLIIPKPTVRMIEVNELSDTNRGAEGFGSSGR